MAVARRKSSRFTFKFDSNIVFYIRIWRLWFNLNTQNFSIEGEGSEFEQLASILSNNTLFQHIGHSEIEEIIRSSRFVDFQEHEIILEEGDIGQTMFVVLEGKIQVYGVNDNGFENVYALLKSGDFFGEQALLPGSNKRRNANVRSLTRSHLFKIHRKTVEKYFTRNDNTYSTLRNIGVKQTQHRQVQQNALFNALHLGDGFSEWIHEYSFSAGDIVFREGDIGENFYMIIEGEVEVSRNESGKKKVLSYLASDHYFGELALVNQEPRSATITAHTDLKLLAIKGERFVSLCDEIPELRAHLNRLSGLYSLPAGGLVTLNTSTLMGQPSTTTVYHTKQGPKLEFCKVIDQSICEIKVLGFDKPEKVSVKLVSHVFENADENIFREVVVGGGKIVSATCRGAWDGMGDLLNRALKGNKLRFWELALFREEGDFCLAGEDDGSAEAIVCKCAGVDRGTLIAAIAQGASTMQALSDGTGAAKICGGCAPRLQELVGRTDMQLACLDEVISVTDSIKSFRFKPHYGKATTSRPSEHIRLQALIDGKWIQRSYTLTSPAGQEDFYEITVKRKADGYFSHWLHDELNESSVIRVSQPKGGYSVELTNIDNIVCFVGGIGLTPVLAMLRSLADDSSQKLYVDYSAKFQGDFAYRNELDKIAELNENIEVYFRDTSEINSVILQDVVDYVDKSPHSNYFICGPNRYQKAIVSYLQEAGVKQSRINVESFGDEDSLSAKESSRKGNTSSYGLAIMSLVVAAMFLVIPSIPDSISVAHAWPIEQLWTNNFYKQITGFSILGLMLVGLLVSARKRIRKLKVGSLATWRMGHMAVGLLAIVLLYLHTGLSAGSNLNLALLSLFIASILLGGITMLAKLRSGAAPSDVMSKTHTRLNRFHIVIAAFIPAVLIVHVVSGYYY